MQGVIEASREGRPWSRYLRPATVGLFLFACTVLSACSTKAVAVQECREIESARCEASVPCGIVEEDGVEECQRFYRDQCLHGIAGPKAPTGDELKVCIELIETAQEAAEASMNLGGQSQEDSHALACEIISRPWDLPQCAFVLPSGEGGAPADDSEDEE